MSIQAMAWALEQQIVADATARHVLLCLANYADKHGKGAFPSVTSLAQDTGLSERSVRSKLSLLEGFGAISRGNQKIAAAHIDRLDRRPVVYDVAMSRGAADAPRDENDGVQDVHPEEGTGCKSRTNGVQMVHERGAPRAPNPSSNRRATVKALDRSPSGSRISDDWTTSPDDIAFAKKHGIDPQTEAEKFRDYWRAQPGAKGRKSDWAATWRTWIRNAVEYKSRDRSHANHRTSAADRVLQHAIEGEQRDAENAIAGYGYSHALGSHG